MHKCLHSTRLARWNECINGFVTYSRCTGCKHKWNLKFNLHGLKIWTDRWANTQGHRQTKLFIHTPDPNKNRGIIRLSRGDLTIFTRAITGHNFLGKHQNYIDPDISKVCRFCQENEETFFHFLTSCPSLRQLRENIFLDKPYPHNNTWSIHKLKLFMLEPSIYAALTSKTGLSQIELEPHQVGLPSDTGSSL